MANIKVKIDYPITDGSKLKFRTPCESTSVEGLVVTYPVKDGVGYAVKNFTFMDAHGKALSGLGNVFTSDVLIEVLLDVTKGSAYIQNANSNTYIEDIKVTVQRMEEERQTIFADAGKSIEECKEATKKANAAASGVVTIEQNSQDPLRFWVGTREEYEAQKDDGLANTFCIISDDPDEEERFTNIERDIANNAESIARNADATMVNAGAIESHAKSLEIHEGAIASNEEAIENNASAIAGLESGKAPAGFGLGGSSFWIKENVDIDTLTNCGWYAYGEENTSPNKPFTYGNLFVLSRGTASTCTQIGIDRAERCGAMKFRSMHGDVWSEWAWDNPPMIPDTEYLTTKWHNKKAVYVKRINYTLNGKAVDLKTLATDVKEIVSIKNNFVKRPEGAYILYQQDVGSMQKIKNFYSQISVTGDNEIYMQCVDLNVSDEGVDSNAGAVISFDIEYTKT